MNKQELVEALAKKAELSKAAAAGYLDELIGIISTELKKGGTVQLTGFGVFQVRKRAARTGRNPRTGKTITIKASKVPAFRAGKGLKDLVNKK